MSRNHDTKRGSRPGGARKRRSREVAAAKEPTIGALVRAARHERGWSQAVLAEKVGIARQTLNLIEHDGMEPGSRTLIALARELGLRIGHLVPEERPTREELVAMVEALPEEAVHDAFVALDLVRRAYRETV